MKICFYKYQNSWNRRIKYYAQNTTFKQSIVFLRIIWYNLIDFNVIIFKGLISLLFKFNVFILSFL